MASKKPAKSTPAKKVKTRSTPEKKAAAVQKTAATDKATSKKSTS